MGMWDVGCQQHPGALEAATRAWHGAGLSFAAGQRGWGATERRRGFSLHHLFVRVSRRAASAARVCGLVWPPPGEPLDVVVLVRARGGSWRPGCCSRRWHQFRVASSKFLHSSRTLFLLFCQPCLVPCEGFLCSTNTSACTHSDALVLRGATFSISK